MGKQKLTEKELALLTEIGEAMLEDNLGGIDRPLTRSEKGVLSQLIQKDLVFDTYDGMGKSEFDYEWDNMWLITNEARAILLDLGVELDYNTYD